MPVPRLPRYTVREMISVRARVRNGRLVVDEPTDLPEGTEIELVAEESSDADVAKRLRESPATDEPLSPEEAKELAGIAARGVFVSHEEVRRKIAAKKV
jgi:hypothetical protein